MTTPPSAVQTIWCELLVGSLVDAGVSLVVISPGSRSTPLVTALASLRPSIELVTIIDERSAAFYALGAARATNRPVALVCTSGTAGAHYLPAVIEASLSHIPLIAITADRPPELLDCGASQTIDQVHLFGRFVRQSFDLGPPTGTQPALRALRRKIVQATTLALGPLPGPVHIEVPLRKPLEPIAPSTDEDRVLSSFAHSLRGPLSIAPPSLAPDASALVELAAAITAEPDGIIVVGAMPVSFVRARDHIFALAERAGYPLIAESGSQLRFAPPHGSRGPTRIDHIDLIPVAHRPAPRIVIQLGAEPIAASWPHWDLSRAQRWVLAPTWADPTSSARVILGDPAASIESLIAQIADRSAPHASFANAASSPSSSLVANGTNAASSPSSSLAANGTNALSTSTPTIAPSRASQQRIRTSAWLDTWRELDARASRHIDRALADHPRSEGAAIRAAIASLPAGAIVQVGNSLPIRVIDLVASSLWTAPSDPRPASGHTSAESRPVGGHASTESLPGRPIAVRYDDVLTAVSTSPTNAHDHPGSGNDVLTAVSTRSEQNPDEAPPFDLGANARRVVTQRGAAGIDGLISSAAGATHAGPVLLVLGDVSFAHDVGGLLATRAVQAPLAILVVDNRGGQIFAGLPVAKAGIDASVVAEHWLTAPELDPAAVATAMGVRSITAASPAAVGSAIADALSTSGVTVIHAPVSATGAHDVRRAAIALMEKAHDQPQPTRTEDFQRDAHVDAPRGL